MEHIKPGYTKFRMLTGRDAYVNMRSMKEVTASEALGGVSEASVHTYRVPGAFELPFAAKLCAESGRFAGVACLGVVIRGETSHYDHVCDEVASGTQRVQLDTGVPCAFGVITAENMDQALARSGGDKRDQGRGAAIVAMRMALLKEAI